MPLSEQPGHCHRPGKVGMGPFLCHSPSHLPFQTIAVQPQVSSCARAPSRGCSLFFFFLAAVTRVTSPEGPVKSLHIRDPHGVTLGWEVACWKVFCKDLTSTRGKPADNCSFAPAGALFCSLQDLDLSYNNLSPEDIWTLGDLSQLKTLRLTANGLRTLPPDLAGSWQ